jgi:hypothetical protein
MRAPIRNLELASASALNPAMIFPASITHFLTYYTFALPHGYLCKLLTAKDRVLSSPELFTCILLSLALQSLLIEAQLALSDLESFHRLVQSITASALQTSPSCSEVSQTAAKPIAAEKIEYWMENYINPYSNDVVRRPPCFYKFKDLKHSLELSSSPKSMVA